MSARKREDERSWTYPVELYADGLVLYWSVYRQTWVLAGYVPDEELAAMDQYERELVREHLRCGDGGAR